MSAVLSAALALALLYRATSQRVQLIIEDRSTSIRTHARTVEAFLREENIALGPNDLSYPAKGSLFGADRDGGGILEVRLARPVLLQTSQRTGWVFTPSKAPQNILSQNGVSVFPGDLLIVDGLPQGLSDPEAASAPAGLALRRAYRIELSIDGAQRILHSRAPTLGQALWEHGIVLFEGDRLDPTPETALRGAMQAQLKRSVPLRISAAGTELVVRTSADTVGGALEQAGLTLQGLDYAVPGETQALPVDGLIRVIRVQERVEVAMQPLAFQTLYQPMPEIDIDSRQVLQTGAYGVVANRVRRRLEDGQEVSRIVQGEWVAKEPTAQIIGYGTKIVVRSMDTPDGPIEYWRAVEMYATSYSPSRAGIPEDHPWFGITASGKPAGKGLVAIDRSLIPFGTMMYVPGYGFAEAADTGGGVKGRWIDLGYDDDNYVPWHRYLTVYFLTPIPPADSIVWIFP